MAIAHRVARIPGMKALLKPLYYSYKDSIRRNRSAVFHAQALSVLADFDRAMTAAEIPYSVFAGTMLGAVREKGFISHDLDIDTCVWNDDYSPRIDEALAAAGFRLVRRFEVEGGSMAREETYQKEGVDVDIFYIYADAEFPTYQCDFVSAPGCASHEESMQRHGYVGVRRIQFPLEYNFMRVPFENIEVSMATNAHEWLSHRYGPTYMTPDPTFHDKGDNPDIRLWEGVRATFTAYK